MLRGRELDLCRDTETLTSTSEAEGVFSVGVRGSWSALGKRYREEVESTLYDDGGRAVAVDVDVRDDSANVDAGVSRPSVGLFGMLDGRSTSAEARVRRLFSTRFATPGRVDDSA